jgi:hypothetical protein
MDPIDKVHNGPFPETAQDRERKKINLVWKMENIQYNHTYIESS